MIKKVFVYVGIMLVPTYLFGQSNQIGRIINLTLNSSNELFSFNVINDSLFVFSDLRLPYVVLYDNINDIELAILGSRGRGPKEIGRINYSTYNKKTKEIYIYDSVNLKILRFTYKGEYIDEHILNKKSILMPYRGFFISNKLVSYAYSPYTNPNIFHIYDNNFNITESVGNYEELTSSIKDLVLKQTSAGSPYSLNISTNYKQYIYMCSRVHNGKLLKFNIDKMKFDVIEYTSILNNPTTTEINPSNSEGYQIIGTPLGQLAYKAHEQNVGLYVHKNQLLLFVQIDVKNANYRNKLLVKIYDISENGDLTLNEIKEIDSLNVNLNRSGSNKFPQYFLMDNYKNSLYFLNWVDDSFSIVIIELK